MKDLYVDYEGFIKEWHSQKGHICCHTSGSTGTPKEILLPKRQMEESARRTITFFGLDSRSHLHSLISPEFIGGKMMAVRSEILNCRFTYETPSNRPVFPSGENVIDLIAAVPSQLPHIISRPELKGRVGSIIIGGSPIPQALAKQIVRSGINAWETYGMTETASHIAIRKVSDENTFFHPLPGINIELNSRGCLVIDISGWTRFETNDIAQISDCGDFRILGRQDNMIISGGRKIHPEQLERIAEELLGREILVSGKPDDKWGEIAVMTISDFSKNEARDLQSEHISHEAIKEMLGKRLPSWSIPKIIRYGEIPHTPGGKKKRC
ncbi:MAG: AMP-binding protein [Candidatus Amulumruptor caecigallinarius]|nr:AMP-binding protein [Candidatus Amulumruptor caecigallinarius]